MSLGRLNRVPGGDGRVELHLKPGLAVFVIVNAKGYQSQLLLPLSVKAGV